MGWLILLAVFAATLVAMRLFGDDLYEEKAAENGLPAGTSKPTTTFEFGCASAST